MNTLPALTDEAVRAWVGERSYLLGQEYFRGNAIFGARRQGDLIKAECEGSSGPYRVWAALAGPHVEDCGCSCPAAGSCKHVAALLLAWLHRPGEFREVEDVDNALGRRDRAELVSLVKEMLRRHPDLEYLLEAPLPAGGRLVEGVDQDVYKRQATLAFRHPEWQLDGHSGSGAGLEATKSIGDGFLHERNYAAAASVYEGVVKAVLENYAPTQDERGELSGVVKACAEGLGQCLAALTADARRASILRVLFDVYKSDLERGGIGMSDGVETALLEHTTAEERRAVASRVRETFPPGEDWQENWRRNCLGQFLLKLQEDALEDEAYLALCRETAQRVPMIRRLLRLGRVDEAVAAAAETRPANFLLAIDLLVQHGLDAVAEKLGRERLQEKQEVALMQWFKKRAEAGKDRTGLVEITEKIFRLQPNLEGYLELRKLSGKNRWQSLRPELLDYLRKTNRHHLLIEVHLREGNIEAALKAVRSERGFGTGMRLQVAAAAEKTHPRDAIDLYGRQVDAELEHRSRRGYQEACRHLRKVRELYLTVNDEAGWARYLLRLRERTRSVPAFHEELQQAKL